MINEALFLVFSTVSFLLTYKKTRSLVSSGFYLLIIGWFFLIPAGEVLFSYLLKLESHSIISAFLVFFVPFIAEKKKFKLNKIYWITILLFWIPDLFYNFQNGTLDKNGVFWTETDRTQHVGYVNSFSYSSGLPPDDPHIHGSKIIYNYIPEIFVKYLSELFNADVYTLLKILLPILSLLYMYLLAYLCSILLKGKKLYIQITFSIFVFAFFAYMASLVGWVAWTVGNAVFLWLVISCYEKIDFKRKILLTSVLFYQYSVLAVPMFFAFFFEHVISKEYKKAVIFSFCVGLLSFMSIMPILGFLSEEKIAIVNILSLQTTLKFVLFCVLSVFSLIYSRKSDKFTKKFIWIFVVTMCIVFFRFYRISSIVYILTFLYSMKNINIKHKYIAMGFIIFELIYSLIGSSEFITAKIERGFILLLLPYVLFNVVKNYKHSNYSKILALVFIIMGTYYTYISYDRVYALIQNNFKDTPVSKYDYEAYMWINSQNITGKTFWVSNGNTWSFCPLPALTKDKTYYCGTGFSMILQKDSGYENSLFDEVIENPSKFKEIEDEIDYIFISSEDLNKYLNFILWCEEDESCNLIYYKKAIIAEI